MKTHTKEHEVMKPSWTDNQLLRYLILQYGRDDIIDMILDCSEGGVQRASDVPENLPAHMDNDLCAKAMTYWQQQIRAGLEGFLIDQAYDAHTEGMNPEYERYLDVGPVVHEVVQALERGRDSSIARCSQIDEELAALVPLIQRTRKTLEVSHEDKIHCQEYADAHEETLRVHRELLRGLLESAEILAIEWEWKTNSTPKNNRVMAQLDSMIRKARELLEEDHD